MASKPLCLHNGGSERDSPDACLVIARRPPCAPRHHVEPCQDAPSGIPSAGWRVPDNSPDDTKSRYGPRVDSGLVLDAEESLRRFDRTLREGTPLSAWTSGELTKIGETDELELASRRRDGTLRSPVTIWVVRVG